MVTVLLPSTRLWAEARGLPSSLRSTVSEAEGFDDLAALLRSARRVVATGNGASYYAAHALWLASCHPAARPGPEVVAVPAGLIAAGAFAWRAGDVLLVVSSSGELRDLVVALEHDAPEAVGAITSTSGSTIEARAAASALVAVESQDAVTHTQAYAGNVAAALDVWARVTGDGGLRAAVAGSPGMVAASLDDAEAWIEAMEAPPAPVAAIAFGSGPAWAAALEASLLLKEVARVPAEGMETREGATSGMYGLGPGQLVLSLPIGTDPLLDEAEELRAATGAQVLRAPAVSGADRRLAALALFAAPLALAVSIGCAAGLDVDRPDWSEAYLATARKQGARDDR